MIDYDLVNKFIGKPWVYIDNDCWAVVKQASREIFGVSIVDKISFSGKPVKNETAMLISEQEKRPCWIKTDKIETGNVIVFSDRSKNPVHVGICIENQNILHCMGGHGVKNGKTRYDHINTVKLIYPTYESYKYVNNDN